MPFESMGHARMRRSSERRQRDDMILIPEMVFRFWAVHKKKEILEEGSPCLAAWAPGGTTSAVPLQGRRRPPTTTDPSLSNAYFVAAATIALLEVMLILLKTNDEIHHVFHSFYLLQE